MRKLLAIAASTAISLGAGSVASANGTVNPECPPPKHHKHHKHHHHRHHPHHRPHHVHHEPHHVPCCPSLHSGFFAGVKGGYGWAKGKVKQHFQTTNPAVTPSISSGGRHSHLGIDGGKVGLFLGYDRYFSSCGNCWVLGLEGSAEWTDLTGRSRSFFSNSAFTAHWNTRLKSDWSYDVAVRLGKKVYECSMWYVKAGAKWTHFKLRSHSRLVTASGTVVTSGMHHKRHKYRAGFLTGLGVEVPVACHWSLGAEYNFTWYQRVSSHRRHTTTTDFVRARIRPYENQLVARVIWKQ